MSSGCKGVIRQRGTGEGHPLHRARVDEANRTTDTTAGENSIFRRYDLPHQRRNKYQHVPGREMLKDQRLG